MSNEFKLLTRKEFRQKTFERDKFKCILCGINAIFDSDGEVTNLDPHHLIERSLWDDGGFYLCNAATLCDPTCHMKAEQTLVSPEELREKCGIKKFILPQSFSEGEVIDKWGNPILPNGQRMKGELFEGHETILAPVLHLFVDKVKFPRTYHLPWSEGRSSDDKVLESLDSFIEQEVVVTVKMDGECLDENTKIVTSDGVKTIKDLCESNYRGLVKSFDVENNKEVWDECVQTIINEPTEQDEWYEITLMNETTITVTGNHLVWLPDLFCWRKVKD